MSGRWRGRLLRAYLRGGWWRWGRCSVCGAEAGFAFAYRPARRWLPPRVVRQCRTHFDPVAGQRAEG